MTTYEITPFVVGVNQTDQGVMTYMKHYGEKIFLPIYMFAVDGGGKKILIDTGLEEFIVPEGFEAEYGVKVHTFEEALSEMGWKPEEVDAIIHTHLHNDHCENDYKCPEAAVYVQKKEHEFLKNPHPLDHRIFDDILDENNVIEIEGDAQIFDGISTLFTPGHTPGGQSVIIETEAGKVLIVGYCSNEKNFPPNAPPVICGVHLDATQAYESMMRVADYPADIKLALHDVAIAQRGKIPAAS